MIGSELTRALDQEFFRWFHLERYEPAQALADGRAWHGFRPSEIGRASCRERV